MRSLSLPRLKTSTESGAKGSGMGIAVTQCPHSPAHSRQSSIGSATSCPGTPTFSLRSSHAHWPGSSSSLDTIPDSPTLERSTLGDLLEEEPLCICDTPLCEHRRRADQSPEWSPGDDTDPLPGQPLPKRRRSGTADSSFSSRLSCRFPSLSRRFSVNKTVSSTSASASASVSAPASSADRWSAPSSRASSLRLSRATRSGTCCSLADASLSELPIVPAPTEAYEPSLSLPPAPQSATRARSRAASRSLEIDPALGECEDESGIDIDRELVSTPLLPPLHAPSPELDATRSPLHSPTVACSAFLATTPPQGTPLLSPPPPPPPLADDTIPPLSITDDNDPHEEKDPWALRLGHANFHISPAPYRPASCDAAARARHAYDWLAARSEHLRQAARIREHYGPTSHIYTLTLQKWAALDTQWQAHHDALEAAAAETAAAAVAASSSTASSSSSASSSPVILPAKFPAVDEDEIVGPMVRYPKMERPDLQQTADLVVPGAVAAAAAAAAAKAEHVSASSASRSTSKASSAALFCRLFTEPAAAFRGRRGKQGKC